MWARIVEILLGLWLIAGPFVVPGIAGGPVNDVICGLAVVIFGSLSFGERLGWVHFLTLFVAVWLIAIGYLAGYPSPPPAQNHIIVGLLLAMFAIIPNRTNTMPASWQNFYAGDFFKSGDQED